MKKLSTLLSAFLVSLMLFGCSGSKSVTDTDIGDIPEWYLKYEKDDNYFVGAATEASRDMQMAIDKAEVTARAKIARQLQAKVTSLQKSFGEELTNDEATKYLDSFREATKVFTNETLVGSKTIKQDIQKDGENYRAYVLMLYPVGEANAKLQQALSKNKEMEVRFRESKMFEDLDAEEKKQYELENSLK